jgi:NAD(P)-dependent dehydrogenase (short-subunit alcohol dehydrogenase family)
MSETQPVVVITGASAGVGRACAQAFARRGARLGLFARGRAGLQAACEEAERLGSPAAMPLPGDVADAKAVDDAAAEVEAELGPIDVWVNNAMVSVFAPSWEVTPEEFARVTQVTYLGTVYGTLAALRRMRPRDAGVIVQVGSALAYRGIPLQSAYCAAKHALKGFNDSLQAELLHDRSRVRVTMLQFSAFNTPQFDWARTHMEQLPRPVAPVPPAPFASA